jgi:predicted phosphodiesterase
MIWTAEAIEAAKRSMRQSGTLSEAAGLLAMEGWPVSTSSLSAAMLRHGLRARDFLPAEKTQACAVAAAAANARKRYGLEGEPAPDRRSVADLRRVVARGPQTMDEVAKGLSVSPEETQRLIREATSAGCPLVIDGDTVRDRDLTPPAAPEIHRAPAVDSEWTGVALISDTHVGHEQAAVVELQDFLRYAHGRGVRHVVHAGDLLDGTYWFRSAHLEQVQIGLDKQITETLRVFPELPGLSYWILGGNHDSNGYWRTCGVDPILATVHRAHATGRTDLHHLGQTVGRLVIGSGDQEIRIEAAHPEKGAGAYALSYGVQKYVEALQGGSKPHVLVCGHMHSYFTTWIRGIWACMPGCWQYQTEYERRKALHPAVGGVIAWIRRSPYAIQVAHEWHGHHAREVEWIHAAS